MFDRFENLIDEQSHMVEIMYEKGNNVFENKPRMDKHFIEVS